MNPKITLILSATLLAATAHGAAPNQEKFNELCWNWTAPPQNITEDVCSCMFNKVSADGSLAPEDVLKIPASFWEKPSSSKPSNPTESKLKDVHKSCASEIFKKQNAR